MKISFNHFLVLIVLIALLTGGTRACCVNESSLVSDGKLDVVVSIVPQKYFVERIGGDRVSVSVMVEPGANPATYEPKPEQLKALSGAAAYFSIGVPFEDAWLGKITAVNEEMAMVDTIAGIERMPMKAHHDDEGEEEHAEGAPDTHVWLSPELVKVQARIIYEALAGLDPAHRAEYKTNLEAFVADIDALQAEIEATLSDLETKKFMVFHPAWGYFAHDFGLEQMPVEVGGQEPSAQELAHLIEEAKAENIRVVFAQPEFSTQDAETIAQEIGGEVLLISPLAPDWLENMRTVARTFAGVLGEEK
jgi:zinc transport system substrate-binding protein